jgi:hypothetical protein
MRRLWIPLLAGLLAVACGDDAGDNGDGAGSGGSDEFCAALEPLADIDPLADPTADEIAKLEAARAAGPEELRSAFDELIAVTELFVQPNLELDDLAQFDEDTQREASAALIAAAQGCGLEVPIFVYGAGEESAGGGDGGDVAAARERFESSDLRAAIEAADPSLEGEVDFIGRGNDDITVQIALLADPDQALAVCEVVDEYLEEIGFPQATVQVTGGTGPALAAREANGSCDATR